ncbi:MAG: hypothetical protein K8S20_07775 [Chloroflexi bacterium]|nr:hypothetical protein [Chloroflexota bacterium]
MLHKRGLPKFNPELYQKIALNDLVVYSIHHFQQDGREITSEDVISACFLLFPRRFSMRNYPHWPDSAVVSRRWTECRSKGYLSGNASEGFKLTARGARFAERVAKKLGVEKPRSTEIKKPPVHKKKIQRRPVQTHRDPVLMVEKHPSAKRAKKAPTPQAGRTTPALLPVIKTHPPKAGPIKTRRVRLPVQANKVQQKPAEPVRTAPAMTTKEEKVRAGKFVKAMERSDAYLHYKKNGRNSKIGEFDFRSLLLCTMESSRETLLKNLALFKGYADIHSRQDLLMFLNHCEYRFSYLLVPQQKRLKKPARKLEKE